MSGRDTPKSESGQELRDAFPTPDPTVTPVQTSEAESSQPLRALHEEVIEALALLAGASQFSRSSNEELRAVGHMHSPRRPVADQSSVPECLTTAHHCTNLIPVSTTSQTERIVGGNGRVSHVERHHEHKSTTSKSPTSPLSDIDDDSETDVTDYDDDDEGMDINAGLEDMRSRD